MAKEGEDGRIRFWGHEVEGAAMAVERSRHLHLSNDEIDRLQRIIRGHMRVHGMVDRLLDARQDSLERGQAEVQARRETGYPSRRAMYRFFRDLREAAVDVILLSLADLRGTYEHTLPEAKWKAALDVSRLLLENYWERPDEVVKPPSLLNGHEVMEAFALSPSPVVGRLLEAIREGQATGEVATKDDALAFGAHWLDNFGGDQ